MATNQAKMDENPSRKTRRLFVWSQTLLRISAFAASLASSLIMATNKQTVVLFGFPFVAKYTYTTAFRFLVIANAVACGYSLLSLPLVVMLKSKNFEQRRFFIIFLLDLMMMGLVMAATSSATTIGYVGRKGNPHTGWASICDNLRRFCDRAGYSIVCSYAALVLFFLLTILSAMKPRPTPVSPC